MGPVTDPLLASGLRQVDPTHLGIDWNTGHSSVYDVRDLRLLCPCAQCIDELTGKKLLVDSTIPPDVKPLRIEPVGRYALHFEWSDGHRTGLYTFVHLLEHCPCADCRAKAKA